MIYNSVERIDDQSDRQAFFETIAKEFSKFIFSCWLWTIIMQSLLVIIIYIVNGVIFGFETSEFFQILIRFIFFSILTFLIYMFKRKAGKTNNYYKWHDIIILTTIIFSLPFLIYYNLFLRNYIYPDGKYYFIFTTETYYISYFLPWLTILNKKLKIFCFCYAESLIALFTLANNEEINGIATAKTFLFLISRFFLGYIASNFSDILFNDVFKVNKEKKEENLKWKKIVNEMPSGLIIIEKKGKKCTFINSPAKRFLDLKIPKTTADFTLTDLNKKLGIMFCWTTSNGFMLNRTTGLRDTSLLTTITPNLPNFEENIVHKKYFLKDFLELFEESENDLPIRNPNEDYDIFYLETEEGPQTLAVRIDVQASFNGVKCFAIFLEDISLREVSKNLKRNYDYQSKLLKSFSHELKTPLNNSIPSLEMGILSLPIEEKIIKESLEPALKSMKILHFVLNSIIDLNSISSNQLVLDIERFFLTDFITSIFSLLESQAEQKGIKLIFKKDPEADENFHNDKERISIILMNLLSNAIKFSFKGNIQVHISKFSLNKLKFSITDNGIGIASNIVAKMNDYFVQKQNPESIFFYFNESSICLGLNVSNKLAHLISDQDIAQQQGLYIESSVENQGTTFSFIAHNHQVFFSKRVKNKNVSIMIIDSSIRSEEENERNFGSFSSSFPEIERIEGVYQKMQNRKINILKSPFIEEVSKKAFIDIFEDEVITCVCPNILIVDDDPFNQLSMEVILKKFKIKCEKANHGLEAIEKIKKSSLIQRCSEKCHRLKLVFMDYQMPILDGVQTTKELREMIKTNEIEPLIIIGCTAFGTKMEVEKFKESGIDGLILKPITINKIKDILVIWNFIDN